MGNYREDFKIEFQPKLTSKEKGLLRYLLDAQKGRGSNKIKVSVADVCSKMGILEDEIDIYIKKLLKKQFSISQGREKLYSNLFEYIKFQDSNIFFAFVKKIFAELDGNKNFLGIDLTPFIYFNEKSTGELYLNLLNNFNDTNTELTYSLDDFKEMLDIRDSYGRFYDFERFVLKKLIKDINENTSLAISYKRVQKTDKKGSKVTGITIILSSGKLYSKKSSVEEILDLMGSRVSHKAEIGEILNTLIKSRSEEEILEVVRFTLKHSEDNTIEKDLLNALSRMGSGDRLIHLEEFKYSNIFAIQSLIMQKLKSLYPEHLLYDSFFSHGLLKELYRFKNKKKFNFTIKDLEILMVLDDNKNVRIEFWERTS